MYSAHQKKKVAEYACHHGARATARHFGVHSGNVERWLKENLDATKGRKKCRNNKGQGRKLSSPVELDEELLQWVLEKRDLRLAVTTEMLKLRAKQIITRESQFQSIRWMGTEVLPSAHLCSKSKDVPGPEATPRSGGKDRVIS